MERVEHRLVTTGDPQADLLHTSPFDVVRRVFPADLVFPLTDGEGQHLSFTGQVDAGHRQDGQLVTFALIDHWKVVTILGSQPITKIERKAR